MARNSISEMTLTARWVFPVDGPPIERGTVTIVGSRILAVEKPGHRRSDEDLGNVAILPGLVNAHAHLDLCGLRGKIHAGLEFTQWLREVVQHRRSLTKEQAIKDITSGIAESLRTGTTLIGDISGQGWSWPALAESPLRAVVFYELLGLSQTRAAQAETEARSWLAGHPATATCRPGLSPHAPYSVRASLFQSSAELARQSNVPLATHLAETSAEIELLQHRSGPFVEFLSELGVWDPTGLVQGPEEVVGYCSGIRNLLWIHANHLASRGTWAYARQRTEGSPTVVYCPRTHAAFGHPPHPFREYLAAGIRVALGTDSLASNPDLDILAEARFLHARYPEVPGDSLLRMITLSGAEALGWEKETGSLTPGKSADLTVLPLPPEEDLDPYNLVFHSNLAVRQVMWHGRWVFSTPPP